MQKFRTEDRDGRGRIGRRGATHSTFHPAPAQQPSHGGPFNLYAAPREIRGIRGEAHMRWFQALLPREDSFFDKFVEHAQILLRGAEALRTLLSGGEGVEEACSAIMRHEEAADAVTRDVFLAVRR